MLLFQIYVAGFKFFDQAQAATLSVVLLSSLRDRHHQFLLADKRVHYNEPDRAGRGPYPRRSSGRRVDAGLFCGCCRSPSPCGRRSIRPNTSPASSFSRPLTLKNFEDAWAAAPFARYFLNTTLLVTGIVAVQFVLCTLAAYAFAHFEFPGKNLLFVLILVQLMVAPRS